MTTIVYVLLHSCHSYLNQRVDRVDRSEFCPCLYPGLYCSIRYDKWKSISKDDRLLVLHTETRTFGHLLYQQLNPAVLNSEGKRKPLWNNGIQNNWVSVKYENNNNVINMMECGSIPAVLWHELICHESFYSTIQVWNRGDWF